MRRTISALLLMIFLFQMLSACGQGQPAAPTSTPQKAFSGLALRPVGEAAKVYARFDLAIDTDVLFSNPFEPAQASLKDVLAEESNGRGADVIIVAAPVHAAQESAIELAAIGGRINMFGGLPKDHPTIQLDSNLVHYKELIVTGTTACSTADCWQASAIVNSGLIDLSDLVSQRFPLVQALAAFAAAEDRKSLKIVLEP